MQMYSLQHVFFFHLYVQIFLFLLNWLFNDMWDDCCFALHVGVACSNFVATLRNGE